MPTACDTVIVHGIAPFVAWVQRTAQTFGVGPSDLIAQALGEFAAAHDLAAPPPRRDLDAYRKGARKRYARARRTARAVATTDDSSPAPAAIG